MINRSLKIILSLIVLSIIILFFYLTFFYKPIVSEKIQIENKTSVEIQTKDKIKNIMEGDKKAKIEILIFESLSCPACATFHKEIYPGLNA